jgi:hypothetical protein
MTLISKKASSSSSLDIRETYTPGAGYYDLYCGNKNLGIILPSALSLVAVTVVVNRRRFTHVPGATTALYTRADQILQSVANDTGDPLMYRFNTTNPCMKEWGRAHGETVFGWDVKFDDAQGFLAEREYTPSSQDVIQVV